MKNTLQKSVLGTALWLGLILNTVAAYAATGYMSFVSTPVPVKTGDAASYMQAGRDWDKATLSGGIAQPIKIQESTITTSKSATSLKLEFVIPDRTMTSVAAGSSTLSCGDRVIVQIDPNKSQNGSLQAGTGSNTADINKDYRYMVTIKDKKFVDPLDASNTAINKPTLYLPNSATGNWKSGATTTAATAIWNGVAGAGDKYSFTLEIPLSEIGSPASDIGLTLAIINDMGHAHVDAGTLTNELTGTAFPSTMGMTSVSDPGEIGCAGATITEPTGNWKNPGTWGTGFFSQPQVKDVVFDHGFNVNLATAIRLGNCDAQWGDILPIPQYAGWDAFQQDPNNRWYIYNPPSANPPPPSANEKGPCRMAIWFNPKIPNVSAGTMTKKRFLVMWAGAGIAPQQWYVAGLTASVAVVAPETQVSFIWNDLPKASYTSSSHPCLRVYVLPEDLTPLTPIPGLATTADYENFIKNIDTQAELTQMENAYNIPHGDNHMAQMNFSNIGPTGGCKNNICYPLEASNRYSNLQFAALEGWSPVPEALVDAPEILADNGRLELDREVTRLPGGNRLPVDIDRRIPAKLRAPSTLIVATGFGVAKPLGKARYVYVEEIGTVAWGINSKLIGNLLKDIKLQIGNPELAAKVFVDGKAVEITAPSRNIFVSVETKSPPGIVTPTIGRRDMDMRIRERFIPGKTLDTRIELRQGN